MHVDTHPRRARGPVAAGERGLGSFPRLLTLGLLAQLVVLWPISETPYWGDDVMNSYVTGGLRWTGMHWWAFFWAETQSQWSALGRPMPLGVLQTFGFFYLVHDHVAYKVMLIVLSLIGSGLIGLLVRRLGASAATAALAAALPAVAWQLHLLHDPLISYSGLMQAVVIYSAGSMLIFLSWLRHGGGWKLGVVALLTLCACFTYESSYLLPAGLALIAWRERGCSLRRAIVLAWPGLAVAAVCIVVVLIHVESFPASSGYQPSASLGVVLSTWAKILASGLPLVGWSVTSGPSTLPATHETQAILEGIVTAVLLFPLLLSGIGRDTGGWLRERRTVLTVVGVAAVLMLTPALLTASAPQYQSQVQWGWGYLPMFFAALGWALLGAVGISLLLARLAPRSVVAVSASITIALAGGLVTALDGEANARVVQAMQPLKNSRDLIESGFTHGVLDQVPAFSTVLWYRPDVLFPQGAWVPGETNLEPWTREFVNRPLTMHLLDVTTTSPVVCTDSADGPAPCQLLKTPTFWLRTKSSGSRGFVAVTEVGVSRWRTADNTERALTRPDSQPLVFVRNPAIAPHSRSLPFSVVMSRGTDEPRLVVPAARLRILREGSGWVLTQLPRQRQFVASSIDVTQS